MELIDVLARIGFDWRMALANIVNFLIVFWLLKKFVWAPVRERIEERQKQISKGLDDAEKAELALSQAKEDADSVLEEAKQERYAIIEGAKGSAQQIVAKANQESVESAERMLENVQQRSKEIEESAIDKVRENSVEFVISAARAVLQDQIDEKRGEELVKKMLKRA